METLSSIPPPPPAMEAERRGRLQIIVGGSKGFSAVRLMLEKARKAKENGVDVIVGRINFRSNVIIKKLLDGLECVPEIRSPMHSYGSSIDVPSVQRRAPSVLIVDTSVPQRMGTSDSPPGDVYAPWKDVEAVIASGIDVWASMDTSRLSCWVAAASGRLRSERNYPQTVKRIDLGT